MLFIKGNFRLLGARPSRPDKGRPRRDGADGPGRRQQGARTNKYNPWQAKVPDSTRQGAPTKPPRQRPIVAVFFRGRKKQAPSMGACFFLPLFYSTPDADPTQNTSSPTPTASLVRPRVACRHARPVAWSPSPLRTSPSQFTASPG